MSKKILVVGASIAGPAVCYWLKKFGFSPTLIEKNDALRKGGYPIDVRGIALEVVKKMGIYEEICDRRTQIILGRYVDASGNTLSEEEGEKHGHRQGEEVEILRGYLVEILMETIKDVPCHFKSSIKQLEQKDGCVSVTFQDDSSEDYDLVIGADGLHSSTRQQIFTESDYEIYQLNAHICVFSIPNYLNLNKKSVLFESNQKTVHVISDHDPKTALVGFMFRSKENLKAICDEAEQRKFIRSIYKNLGWETNKLLALMADSDDLYFDSIAQVKMSNWTNGRVALLGDAAYCASPLSGQGTSLALVGAYLLAGELKNAGENYLAAFERYNALMRPFVEANQSLGAWVSQTYMIEEDMSSDIAEKRTHDILEKMKIAAYAIKLPTY